MTKAEQVQAINAVISGPRGELARAKCALAAVVAGKVLYTDRKYGHERKISRFELFAYLHGEDIRALKAVI